MSGRRRRSEASWEKKEEEIPPTEIHSNISWGNSEKWPNSEVNDDMAPGNFSGRQSWDPVRSGPKDDDISRDRHDLTSDEWEKQYSTRPSCDSYGPPYRAHERRVGGNARMSRDRDRTRSPNRSRTRSRDRAQDVTRSRSRSRSRNRDWESTRAQTRSPFYDNRRESKEYSNVRDWNHRPDYTNDSRYEDYHHRHHHRDDRNQYHDQNQNQNHRRQSNRDTRIIPCKFFAAGNCNRDDCRFSHDVIESGRYDRSESDNNIRAHNSGNKNRTWNEQHPHDDVAESNFVEKKKPWDGHTSWDDVGPRGYNERQRDDVGPRGYNERPRDDVGPRGYNERPRDDVGPPGYNERSHDDDIHNHTSHDKKRTWDDDDLGFQDVGKSKSYLDNKKRSRDDDVHDHTSHDNKRTWNDDLSFQDVGKSKYYSDNKKNSWNGENNIDEKRKKWIAPLWGEVSQPEVKKSGWGDLTTVKDSEENNKLLPQLNNVGIVVKNSDFDLNNDNIVSEDANRQITSVDDMNSQSLSYLNKTENHFNGPKFQLNGQVKEDMMYSHKHTQNQSKESGKPLKNLENNSEIVVMEKESVGNPENRVIENENGKQEEENNNDNHNTEKVEGEGDFGNDEKAMKLFKVALVEFVKEILKPKWKEGKMSRDVHKNVVKKVVEKVTSTMHGVHIPRTQPKIDQYLGYSKSKITKLVEAYVGKLLKA